MKTILSKRQYDEQYNHTLFYFIVSKYSVSSISLKSCKIGNRYIFTSQSFVSYLHPSS